MEAQRPIQNVRRKGWKIKTTQETSEQAQVTQNPTTEEHLPSENAGSSLRPIDPDLLETVRTFFDETKNTPVRVTAVMDAGDGWDIEVELMEEQAYTQRYGRDQLIGIYEATMDQSQTVTSYQRKSTRARSVPFEKKKIRAGQR